MTRLLSDVRVRVAACVLAMAAVAGLAVVTHPKEPVTRPEAVSEPTPTVVNRTAQACPVPSVGGKLQSFVNAVAPVLPKDTPIAEGSATPLSIAPLPKTSDPVGSLLVRGRLTSTARAAKPVPLSIQGTGPLAAGTVGTSTSISTEGVNRGMASVPCQTPGSDFWFVGASAAAGRRDVLVLTNLDSINAEVNVSVYAPGGALDLPNARGIVVPARGSAELYLSLVAPKMRDLALHVVSNGGRVAPALRDNATNADGPAGVDWLHASAPPAKSLVVPGIAPGAGERSLTLANPGDLQATATLTVNGPNGPFKPAGLSTVQIPAGAVKSVRMDKVLNGDASAITISSDQPLAGSVRNVDASGTEFSSMGSAEALSGPAYLVLPPHAQPAQLQVTAPSRPASMRYELRDATGKVLSTRTLDVVNGATSTISFKAQAGPTYLMVEQTRGSMVAGVTLMPPAKLGEDEVPLAASWPLTTSLVFRAQLGAQPDVRAALK
ncbi:DUF5719 family protein [Kribbella sp. VKM Ac-2568]|uniref:DUF5719 family protein n=1 Tax=Kribbella sp. VKM Ac-2568 TaxID=2512219 RepID=UPI00104BA9A5|nr:DUF5719 family protein [Kribbella sp. VKM Ac-2568]TCM37838.1 hypothetical protein EV648_11850 [Kribbella sp. VKM Ac-2568]